MSNEVRRCSRCILPENFPGIAFDANGVCNICLDYEHRWRRWKEGGWRQTGQEWERIVRLAKRRRRPYDCIVPLSGGKDSTYVLYLCRKVHGMKTLAVNINNGFQTEAAVRNIRRTVEALDVDLLTFAPDRNLLKDLNRCFLLKAGECCTPCNMTIILFMHHVARLEKIPLIVYGNSPRTDEKSPPEIYTSSRWYFLRVLQRHNLLRRIRGTVYGEAVWWVALRFKILVKLNAYLARFRIYNFPLVVNLPAYVEWDERALYETIRREVQWGGHDIGEEHMDCWISGVKCYLRHQRWGFGSKTQKLAALVRDGQMTRDEALRGVSAEGREPDELDPLLRFLGLDRSNLPDIRKSYHMDYV